MHSEDCIGNVINYLAKEQGGWVELAKHFGSTTYPLTVSFHKSSRQKKQPAITWLICLGAETYFVYAGGKEAEDFDKLADLLCAHLNTKGYSTRIVAGKELHDYEP